MSSIKYISKSIFEYFFIGLMRLYHNKTFKRIYRDSFFKFLSSILFHKTFSVSSKINGLVMYANSLDRIMALFLWKLSFLEDFEFQKVRGFVKKGMIVLDIGSNIGFYTLQFSKLVGKNGKVFAFEPDPDNYSLLAKNIEKNNLNNVIAIKKAVLNKTGPLQLYLCKENRGDHRIFESNDERDSIKIDGTKIDDIFSSETKIDIIKMDIQGSEYLAVEGMHDVIERNEDIIIITEFSPYRLKKCGFSGNIFLNKIKEIGFKTILINEKEKVLEEVSSEELSRLCNERNPHDYVNIILMKN